LEVEADPLATDVPDEQLGEFVGEWPYPPAPSGQPAEMNFQVTVGDGHLVVYSPMAGTFKLYLQADGTFHMEDSHERYEAVRDASGAFAGFMPAGEV
jgi:hypothetical protein